MIYLLIRWALNAMVLWMVAFLVPGVTFASNWSVLVTSLVFGLINAVVRPLVLLLTLPANILTLGLFTFIINGLMFWLASTVVKGFEVADFWAAFWAALIYWLITAFIGMIEKPKPIKAKRVR